ncbi:hypothetical protein [Nocardia sp. BMG51109]|uniref:hypothetical protein n=1 Tax=Nocardia sp. BMG51109 TaxID=1056816 RepID=UPI000463599F|nr:hypothetical protein [Nocardia sp. BMG51109]
MPVVLARILAVPVSVWLPATLDAGYRADNIFALPDAAFSPVPPVAAVAPTRLAAPALTAGFFFGSGVITVAPPTGFARDEFAQGVLDLVVAAGYLGAAALLVARGPMRSASTA